MAEPTTPPDPRRNAWRADLAAEKLRGTVKAPRYVDGTRATVVWPVAPLRNAPEFARGFETELLFGETVVVYETSGDWAWVQASLDDYVGYVPAKAVAAEVPAATHVVRALGTFVYPVADLKAPPIMHLSIAARVGVRETSDRFAALTTGGFVMAHHVMGLDEAALDFADVAERFIGTPYLWGGRSRLGVDCSGLLQLSMQQAGLICPRDSDMQRDEIGKAVPVPPALAEADRLTDEVEGLQRGDILYWPGHVAIATDGQMIVHANGHHMSTVIEPALEATVRIKRQTGHPVTAVRRPDRLGRARGP